MAVTQFKMKVERYAIVNNSGKFRVLKTDEEY